jgi:hypothetical protein
MIHALLLMLFLQAGQQAPGIITGVVRSSTGAPTAGVRVYAMAVRETADANSAPPAIESQAQTDANGRYQLEIQPGRYYIASGSVAAPTFFPGTTDVNTARVITVASGVRVDAIDFGSFVPAQRFPAFTVGVMPAPPPGSTGVLSGTVRYSDGRPASGITVSAFPQTGTGTPATYLVSPNSASITLQVMNVMTYGSTRALTAFDGTFTISSVPPNTYYIVAGFEDAPVFFPNAADISTARPTRTTPQTNLTGLDFTLPLNSGGVSVGGHVFAGAGRPAIGASISILRGSAAATGLPAGVLPTRSPTVVDAKADGSFEIANVVPGTYRVEAQLSGMRPQTSTLVVGSQPVRDLAFSFPIALLTGRLLMEDGSPVPNVLAFGEALVTTALEPNLKMSTIFAVGSDGTFARVIEPQVYRFYLRHLPEGYTIRSMKAGEVDLLQDWLKVQGTEPVSIDVRIASSTAASMAALPKEFVKFTGTIRDSVSGLPTAAERLTLCCLDSGPAERFSTLIQSDGSFEFAAIPAGRYELRLQTKGVPTLSLVNSEIAIGKEGAAGVELKSTIQLPR